MRQKIRRILLYVSLFLFPITMNFLSPYVSIDGAFAGVLSGSAVVMCIAGAAIGLVSGHCVPMILSVANADNPGNSSLISSSFLVSIYATNSISSLAMGALASWTNLNVMMMLPAVSAAVAALVVGIILREEKAKQAALA